MNEIFEPPKWSREILRFLPIKPQFTMWGNINDVFPIKMSESITTLRLTDYLRQTLMDEGYELVTMYEPLIGFSLLSGEESEKIFNDTTGGRIASNAPYSAILEKASEIVERLVNDGSHPCATIFNFTSRITDICEQDAMPFFYRMFKLSLSAAPKVIPPSPSPKFNPIFWIIEKENDLPAWYALDNPKVRVIPIPRPDHTTRKCVINSLASRIDGYADINEKQREDCISLFCDQTSGLFAGEIVSIVQMAKKENITLTRIAEAITRYKLGIVENLWSKLDFKKVRDAETELSKKVMGQAPAVRHAADILKRSVFNLSGSQFSKHSQRPKGVLFLAGPTGVGKTELAKAITELIFGSPTNYIRFDMSEFGHEHSDQRLVGAPPGYVGYDVGGELTNSIKQNPFSVVLFDEVEKANPKILDMFLQILDDGRLTSGRGETVYFSESLIIFTSNLGMFEQLPDGTKRQNVSSDMSYEETYEKITNAIDDFFKFKISRPEILNRIGKNIVVFDFIREETARKIFERMLSNVLFRLDDSHKIKLEITEDAKEKLITLVCKDLSMGGRGVGNNLEEILVNPMSRALFEIEPKQGDRVRLENIEHEGGVWRLTLVKAE